MIAWIYFALCELAATAFFWMPLWWWKLPPIGLSVAVLLCLARAWRWPYANSIKPLPLRKSIDGWPRPFNALWGNPEDGVSGLVAFGPSWTGAYNPTGSIWLAICWQCRNWLAGFNYLTWPWAAPAPLLIKAYSVFGRQRQLKVGWQQLPAADGWTGPYRCRMVCSL